MLVVNAPAPAPKTTPTLSWPAPSAITQGTALSATQLNATASVAGTFAYSPAAGTVLATGTHTLTATFTPADTTRYNTATASTVLVVNAAPRKTTPTLSWPTPAAITQGTALSATQLNASASVAGTFVYSPAAGTVLATGTHTLTATFTPTDTTLYNTATGFDRAGGERAGAGAKTTPTLSWPAPAGHHAGHGAQRDAAERPRQRGWHVRLQPRGRHGAPDGNPYADGHLHARRTRRATTPPPPSTVLSCAGRPRTTPAITGPRLRQSRRARRSARRNSTPAPAWRARSRRPRGRHRARDGSPYADGHRHRGRLDALQHRHSLDRAGGERAGARAQDDAHAYLAGACGDHAGHGTQRDAAERQRQRGWHVRLQPRGRHRARDGNPYADGHLHPGRHDALQHRHRLDRAGGQGAPHRAPAIPGRRLRPSRRARRSARRN